MTAAAGAGRPALFLDRDGVINDVVWRDGVASSPRRLDELDLRPDAAGAVRRARAAGFVTVVVTNQPDLSRGLLPTDAAAAIDDAVRRRVGVDAQYVCGHERSDGCPCRKPRPGLLLRAADELGLDLARSWMVGDRWVDVAAGRAAGVRTVWLRTDYGWADAGGLAVPAGLAADHTVADLDAAVDAVLAAVSDPSP